MLILFDQGTPLPIRSYLQGHTVRTAYQQGWDKLKNGELLAAAENAGFELFVTTDKNIRYQQNLNKRKISVLVLGRQQWPHVQAYIQLVVDAVNSTQPGSFKELNIPLSE